MTLARTQIARVALALGLAIGVAGLPREASAQPATLTGVIWEVQSIGTQRMALSRKPTLRFDDRSAGGDSSCNSYGGQATYAGGHFVIHQIVSTMRACSPDIMAQEQALFRFLEQRLVFAIDAEGRLRLTGVDGRTLVARRR